MNDNKEKKINKERLEKNIPTEQSGKSARSAGSDAGGEGGTSGNWGGGATTGSEHKSGKVSQTQATERKAS